MNAGHYRQADQRRAFTLIEVLVVIAIIAVLLGLLLPAVQTAREAVGRAYTANNLRQIGEAVHLFHDNRNYLPYNGLYDDWGYPGNIDSGSWCYQILPFLDQNDIYMMATVTNDNGAMSGPDVYVPVYNDPARSRPPFIVQPNITHSGPTTEYAINCWLNDHANGYTGSVPNRRLRLEAIQDGVSNTILAGMISLRTGEYVSQVAGSWNETWFSGGYGGSGRNGFVCAQDSPDVVYADGTRGNWGGPHSGGCHFVFCDGSVHVIIYATDLESLIRPDDGARTPPIDD